MLPMSSMERRSYESPTVSAAVSPSATGRKPTSEFPFKSTNGLQSTVDTTSQQRHQRFVLSDPVAFSYLEEDRHAVVLERSRQLEGYQTYVVEQWACSRTHPTFVIIAYTGDTSHTIKAGVLSVPADEESWSPRMRVYFKSLAQYHARHKETPLGTLMVTNLSTFPSSLTIVHIPDGDLRKHREEFFVAENLKRFGCSGRVGLSIAAPSSATQAKFYQLYKISDKISLTSSVIELVKLCQVSLILFGCLGPEYGDGLLCDITEAAINDWWAQMGSDLYNVEPSDGVLGPTSVAALLGTLMGARNRLNAYGAPVTKDVFDIEQTKRAVAYFQKTQRLRKTRRLDRHTLFRLHKATAKQASGEGWGVPRAVKSTVAELSGKGGEMVMDMVGRAEKANISEIETVDIERFTHLVKGERAKWLWHGKPRKRTTRDIFQDIDEEPQTKPVRHSGEQSARDPLAKISRTDTVGTARTGLSTVAGPLDPVRSSTDVYRRDLDATAKHGAFHRAKGRIKGVVGLRTHHQDGIKGSASAVMLNPSNDHSAESLDQLDTEPQSPASLRQSAEIDDGLLHPEDAEIDPFSRVITETPLESTSDPSKFDEAAAEWDRTLGKPIHLKPHISRTETQLSESMTALFNPRTADGDLLSQDIGPLLRRTQSFTTAETASRKPPNENWWPRALSFSAAEDSIFPIASTDIDSASPSQDATANPQQRQRQNTPRAALARELQAAETTRRLRARIAHLSTATASHVASAIGDVEDLDVLAGQDAEQLNHLFYPRKDEFNALQTGSLELVTEGRGRLQRGLREVEVLQQKLEYEIGALRGKVEDVEGAVDEFERQVNFAEGRVRELVSGENRESWLTWLARALLGSGATGGSSVTAPPINSGKVVEKTN